MRFNQKTPLIRVRFSKTKKLTHGKQYINFNEIKDGASAKNKLGNNKPSAPPTRFANYSPYISFNDVK